MKGLGSKEGQHLAHSPELKKGFVEELSLPGYALTN